MLVEQLVFFSCGCCEIYVGDVALEEMLHWRMMSVKADLNHCRCRHLQCLQSLMPAVCAACMLS